MKTLTKKIVSVMMAATCLGAAPIVLPEALKPAAITASAHDPYTTAYYNFRIPVNGYNYGWYPHTGSTNYDRECIKFIQAYYNGKCGNGACDIYGNPLQKIVVDGYYGYNTQQAVLKMQQIRNRNMRPYGVAPIAEDGIFGPGTFRALMPSFVPWGGRLYSEVSQYIG